MLQDYYYFNREAFDPEPKTKTRVIFRRSFVQVFMLFGGLALLMSQVTILHRQVAMHDLLDEVRQLRQPAAPPHKLVLSGLTPTADQMMRADCWIFSVVGVLEDSYRRFGVAKGWLAPDRFLRISRQAFGAIVMELCRRRPNLLCPATLAPGGGKIQWGNTSEWGDLTLLRVLPSLGDEAALPGSVCPYTPTAGPDQGSCPGLVEAKASNPLRFKVKRSQDLFERADIKAALLRGGRVLTLAMPMLALPFYLPCTAATAAAYACDPADAARCVACPLERAYAGVGCCVEVNRSMVSMKGEWRHVEGGKVLEAGGHAVGIVGYSDVYRDEAGNTGGFIVRNSWSDGLGTQHGAKGRGSHSAAFFAQSQSDADEALACPNPHSPRSWQRCADLGACRSPLLRLQARAARKPLHLRCIDDGAFAVGVCERGGRYFLKNVTEWGGGLHVACLLRDSPPPPGGPAELCAPPLLLDDLATIFVPVDDEVTLNDPAMCGYNFLPYATFDLVQARLGTVFATEFDIEWSEESYPPRTAADARAAGRRAFDYTLVQQDTLPLPQQPRSAPVWL